MWMMRLLPLWQRTEAWRNQPGQAPCGPGAIRLIRPANSVAAIGGKSLNLAAARTIDHLRPQQVHAKFPGGGSEVQRGNKPLRRLHRLSVEAVFRQEPCISAIDGRMGLWQLGRTDGSEWISHFQGNVDR